MSLTLDAWGHTLERLERGNHVDRWRADPVAWLRERLGEEAWSKHAQIMPTQPDRVPRSPRDALRLAALVHRQRPVANETEPRRQSSSRHPQPRRSGYLWSSATRYLREQAGKRRHAAYAEVSDGGR